MEITMEYSPREMPDLYTWDSRAVPNGLNWDFIRERYLANCSEEEREAQLESLARPMSERIARSAADRRPALEATRTNTRTALGAEQIELIIDYYNARNRVAWIAKEIGTTDQTVRKYLKDAGVYDPKRDRGR